MSRYVSRRHLYAKFRRAKDTAHYSSNSLREILGGGEGGGQRKAEEAGEAEGNGARSEAPSDSASPSPSLLTVPSALSMADYFQAKMKLRSLDSAPLPSTPAPSPDAFQAAHFDRLHNATARGRGGLGFHSTASPRDRQTEERKEAEERRVEEKVDTLLGQSLAEASDAAEVERRAETETTVGVEEEEDDREERRRRKKERRRKERGERLREGTAVGGTGELDKSASLPGELSEPLPSRKKRRRSERLDS